MMSRIAHVETESAESKFLHLIGCRRKSLIERLGALKEKGAGRGSGEKKKRPETQSGRFSGQGGSRTHTVSRSILSRLRLPFRHLAVEEFSFYAKRG